MMTSAPVPHLPHEAVEAEVPRPACEHQLAARDTWPWLPAHRGHLAKHPWCAQCGMIAASGGEKALNFGGIVNEVAHLCRAIATSGRKVTDVQRRLILQRLQALDAHDRFTLTRDRQEQILLQVVSQYTGVHPDVIATYTRAH